MTRARNTVRLLAGALVLLLAAACGSVDDPGAPLGDIEMPFELDAVAVEIEGASLEDAEAWADRQGAELRIVRLDGEDLAATTDFVPERINIFVADDVVTEVSSIG
ncbi:MAG: hypothetical protein AAGA99_25115 [Actinomycetota bacterium]